MNANQTKPVAPTTPEAQSLLGPNAVVTRDIVDRLPCVVFRVFISNDVPCFSFVSAQSTEMLGISPEDLLIDPSLFLSRIAPEDGRRMLRNLRHALNTRQQWVDIFSVQDHGQPRWLVARAAVHGEGSERWADGYIAEVPRRASLSQDARRSQPNASGADARSQHLAHIDELTELPNRGFLMSQLETQVELAQRAKQRFGVLFINLDRFMHVNESLGHAGGDRLLTLISRRMRGFLRHTDIVARVGGDEFIVILTELQQAEDATALADSLLQLIAQPATIAGHELSVSASIGISLFPDNGLTANDLVRNADVAMCRAKTCGRNGYQVYAANMNTSSPEKLQLEHGLRLALERGELALHYQPQVDTRTGEIVGAEALVRWNRPGVGLVTADMFIPVAEECGLILQMGQWVIGEAIRQIHAWQVAGLPPVTVAVNLSATEFLQPNLVENITATLESYGVSPSLLEIELTERIAARDVEATRSILQRLHALGVRLSLDDFGVGYSSLSCLRHFPIDKIKVDRSFVEEMTRGTDAISIVHAILALAKALSLRVIAEGVETAEQLALLRAASCDEIQGYLASGALPPQKMAELLKARSRLLPASQGGSSP